VEKQSGQICNANRLGFWLVFPMCLKKCWFKMLFISLKNHVLPNQFFWVDERQYGYGFAKII
jgi:hypothetical protein